MSLRLEHDYIGSSSSMEKNYNKNNLKQTELRLGLPGSESPERDATVGVGVDLSLGVAKNFMSGAKRERGDANNGNGNGTCKKDVVLPSSPKSVQDKKPQISSARDQSPPTKAQVVGWPPIRSFRKNTMAANPAKANNEEEAKNGSGCLFVKVSMDGAPYLRKVDLKIYSNYMELSSALEKMFSCFTIGQCGSRDGLSESRLMDLLHGSECVLTYEDKDGDWMLVGDVPWDMFIDSCRRLRIMKGSEAIGLAPRAMEKCKNRN